MSYGEYEGIARRRVGTGVLGVGAMDQSAVNAAWEAGTNALTYDAATQLRSQTTSTQGLSAKALANIQKWDAYVAKLTTVSKLTPQQYAAQKSKGSLLGQLLGGKSGGLLDKVKSAVGLGTTTPAPLTPLPGSQTSILDDILTPVGLFFTVGAAAVGGYFYTKSKKKGRRR